MYRAEDRKELSPTWGFAESVPGEKRGPFISSWARGWFFLHCHFGECVLPLASWPGRSRQAQGATNAGLFTLFGWRTGLGTKLAHKFRFSHFISRAASFRALKTGYGNTELVRGAKVNAIHRPHCLQNNFPIFETTTAWFARVIQKGGKLEWFCLFVVRLYAEIIWDNKKNFLGTPNPVYFWTVWFPFLPIILGHPVN